MEICMNIDEDYKTDIEINPKKLKKEEKAKLISALKSGKKYTLKDYTIRVRGEFYQDIDLDWW